MAVECTGRNVEVTASLKQLAEERTHRLERHLGGPADVRVVLSHEKHRFGAEIIAIHRRRRWKAQEETADPRAAVAAAFEKIDAQAMRDSEKRRDKKHRGWARFLPKGWRAAGSAAGAASGVRARVVRTIPSAVKPMSVDEAALALESSGQEVLVFRDSSSDRVSVLFRRGDGDLGLIVPEC
ncbi:MAG TPA: ribosome-associated translation inhibitor RaiA [Thermoanaerobaculia bacterium]|jgi:putative sigma-54 modulation protein